MFTARRLWLARLLLAVFSAVVLMAFHGHQYISNIVKVDQADEDHSLTIQAVKELPWGDGLEVVASTNHAQGNLKLRWYKALIPLKPGDVIDAVIKTKPPHGLRNIGGFSYQRYLLAHNIVATGTIKSAALKKHQSTSWYWPKLRKSIRDQVKTLVAGNSQAGVLTALILGERKTISPTTRDAFQVTGTAHLMAISGLHVGMVFFAVATVVKAMLVQLVPIMTSAKRLMPNIWLPLKITTLKRLHPQTIAHLVGFLAAFGYGALSDFALPTIRALIFLAGWIIAGQWRWRLSAWRILMLAATLFVTVSPNVVYSASFWLSFFAVFAVLTGVAISRGFGVVGLRRLLIIQLCIFVVMLPLQSALFGQQSMLAPVVNLIAIPWVGLSILPAALLAVVALPVDESLANGLLWVANIQLDWLVRLLQEISRLNWQLLPIDGYSVVVVLISTALLLIWVWIARWLIHSRTLVVYTYSVALISVAVCWSAVYWRQYRPDFTLDVLDVGQGLSVVARKHTSTMIYDVGPAYPSGFNMADAVITPYFRQQGIPHIELLVLSHDDNDHIGSSKQLASAVSIGNYLAPKEVINKLAVPPKQLHDCHHGDAPVASGLTIRLLPTKPQDNANDNDRSCVVYVAEGLSGVLLPGDISKTVERGISTGDIAADILVAPHHGSDTSSSSTFIQAVNPDYVIYSAGYRNRWRLPAKKVQQRYQTAGVTELNTSTDGLIRFVFVHDHWRVQTYCDLVWPVWYECDRKEL
ncbi:DNA internalization-related competence protein ComEC/Rec2 [Neiella marina]|uniref:DNA internalization-related competence protein ComEC/Rec2 n=1 Tax=Neiella holothuriorum TaxID=2870530 RepID=A0ABS7EDE5_9GAMM|nr:DNA internalization-related competence protein ComEC/Rec2 [Neiella holothuriorum]